MNTTTELLIVDGVSLNNLGYNQTTLAGRMDVPAYKEANVDIPQRHGDLYVPNKHFTSGTLNLAMWVLGVDEDGNTPIDGWRAQLQRNIDMLVSLFAPAVLHHIVQTLPDGTQREIYGELADVISPEPFGTANIGVNFGVSLRTPKPFWQSLTDSTVTYHPGASPDMRVLAPWTGCNAPVDDLKITFTGPCSAPSLAAGHTKVTYSGVLAAGQSVTVDAGAFSISGSGISPVVTNVLHEGDAHWFELPGSDPTVTFSASGGVTSATAVTVTGRRRWMNG